MKKFLLSLAFTILFPLGTFAADEPKVVMTYEEYLKNTQAYCDVPEREWHDLSRIVPVPQYAKLSTDAISAQIDRTRSLGTLTTAEKTRLQEELDKNRIGDFSGYKAVEVARLQYRSTMNTLFACSVVESRIGILQKLTEEIARHFPASNSEIKKKLQTEAKKLEKQSSELSCSTSKENT